MVPIGLFDVARGNGTFVARTPAYPPFQNKRHFFLDNGVKLEYTTSCAGDIQRDRRDEHLKFERVTICVGSAIYISCLVCQLTCESGLQNKQVRQSANDIDALVFLKSINLLMESLILAQDERLRRA